MASRTAGLIACACAHMRARHRARSLWGGGTARALAARVCRATRVRIGPPALEGRRASGRALSFGARPWCHALALAALRAADLRMCVRERPPLLFLVTSITANELGGNFPLTIYFTGVGFCAPQRPKTRGVGGAPQALFDAARASRRASRLSYGGGVVAITSWLWPWYPFCSCLADKREYFCDEHHRHADLNIRGRAGV